MSHKNVCKIEKVLLKFNFSFTSNVFKNSFSPPDVQNSLRTKKRKREKRVEFFGKEYLSR